ncbi:hypothetical protein ACVWWN_004010 [Mycobacterium sp. URHB0021]|jgi:hypothetical protein
MSDTVRQPLSESAEVMSEVIAGAHSPTPVYLRRWGFSVTILTVLFAVYVAGLVATRLTVGSLSDHLGRRPVLVAFSRVLQWWGRLHVTAVGRNSIRECITESRCRVRSKITDCAIAATIAIGLTAVSLVLAVPASATHRHGTDGRAVHTATSASQDRDRSVGDSSQRSRRDGVDNVGKVATDASVGEPATAAEPDTANPGASAVWLPGHDKCKKRIGFRLLPLWCTDPAPVGLAVLPIRCRIIRVPQSASMMPAAFILPRVAAPYASC